MQYDEFGEELGGSSGESDDDAGEYDEDAGSDEDEVSSQGSRLPSGLAVRLRAARRCRILVHACLCDRGAASHYLPLAAAAAAAAEGGCGGACGVRITTRSVKRTAKYVDVAPGMAGLSSCRKGSGERIKLTCALVLLILKIQMFIIKTLQYYRITSLHYLLKCQLSELYSANEPVACECTSRDPIPHKGNTFRRSSPSCTPVRGCVGLPTCLLSQLSSRGAVTPAGP